MHSDTKLILIWIAVLLFAAVTIYALWWSLYWDRPRGRRRCPKCWHLLHDRFPFRCAECGYVTVFEGNLLRTRRRWGWAAVSLIVMMTGTLWLRSQLVMRSWLTLFPDRLIIMLLPLADDSGPLRDIPQYLAVRLERDDIVAALSNANALRLLAQCAEGDPWAPPGSDHWRWKYMSIADWLLASLQQVDPQPRDIDALERGLNTIPPFIRLDSPALWNAAEPVVVKANVRSWWPTESAVTMRFESASGIPLDESAVARLRQEVWERATTIPSTASVFTIDLGRLPVGKHSGEILLHWTADLPATSDASAAAHSSPAAVRSEGVVPIPFTIDVLPDAQSLTPLSTPQLDALVKETFDPGMLRWPEGRVRHAFQYQLYNTASNDLDSVAFGLIVEALEDGVPRRQLNVWWRGGRGGVRAGWSVVLEDQEALDRAAENAHWTMRIRGDEALARRAAGLYVGTPITQWWSGKVEFPLTVHDQTGERTGRVWVLRRPAGAAREPPR